MLQNTRGSEIFNYKKNTPEAALHGAIVINQTLEGCNKTLAAREARNNKAAKFIKDIINYLKYKPTINASVSDNGNFEKSLWLSYYNSRLDFYMDIEFVGNMIETYIYPNDEHKASAIIKRTLKKTDKNLLNSYVIDFMEQR